MSAPPAGAHRIARNTLLNIAAQVVPLLVAVATIPPLIAALGEARFGLLALAWIILGYFGVFDLGMGRAATRFVAEALGRGDAEPIPGIVWTATAVQALFGAAAAVLLAAAAPALATGVFTIPPALHDDAIASLRLLALGVPFVLIAGTFRGALEAAQRFDLVNIVRVPATCLNYLLALGGVLLGFGLPAVIAMLIVSRMAAALAFALLAARVFPGLLRSVRPDRAAIRSLAGYGGWITVSAITIPVLSYVEQFMIASLLSVAALTFYSAPFEMVSRTAIIPAAFALTLFPAYSFLQARDGSRVGELSWRPLKHLVAAVLPPAVVLGVFAPDILRVWLGADFATGSTTVLRILVVAFSINALATIPFAAVQGLGRPDLKARLDLVEVPLFAALALLLIPRYGIAGAALAKLAVATFDTVALFWMAGRLGALSPARTTARGVPAIAGAAAVYALAAVAVGVLGGQAGFALRLGLVATASAAFLLVYVRFAIDATDRALLGGLLRARRAPAAARP
jgi:O-antigen/teichoic acid export membrane protein